MAHKVATALERGWHFRRVGHSTVRRIIESGARGCQVIIAGKITGARHRTEKFTKGHVKYCGEVAKQVMDTGMAIAKKKPGVLGIKVRIMKPGMVMPDEVKIIIKTSKEEVKQPEEPEIPEEVQKEAKKQGDAKKEKTKKAAKPSKASEPIQPLEEKIDQIAFKDIDGIGPSMVKQLKKAGVRDVRELYEMNTEDIIAIKGIGVTKAKQLKEAIEKAVRK